MAFIVTADSKPLYDSFGTAPYWGCREWILWHKELLKKYQKDQADSIWVDAWLAGLSKASGGNGTAEGSGIFFDSVPIDCRSFNQEFKDYLEKNPSLKSAVFEGVAGLVGKATSTAATAWTSGSDIIDNIFKGAKNASSTFRWLIPLILFMILLTVGIIVYKKYVQNASN